MDVVEQIPVPTTMSAIGTLRRALELEAELEGMTASAGIIADYEDQYLDELTGAVEQSLRSIRKLVISRIRAKATAITPIAATGATFANPWHDEIGRFAPKGTGRKLSAEWGTDRKVTITKIPLGHKHSVTVNGETIELHDVGDVLSLSPNGERTISDLLNGVADAHELSPGMDPPKLIAKDPGQLVKDMAALYDMPVQRFYQLAIGAGAWTTQGIPEEGIDNPAPGVIFVNPKHILAEARNRTDEMPAMVELGPARFKAMHEYGHLRMTSGLDNPNDIEILYDDLGGQYGVGGRTDLIDGMSKYGRSRPIEAHAEAWAEWSARGGDPGPPGPHHNVVADYAAMFEWGREQQRRALAAAGPPSEQQPIIVADGPDGPSYIYPDGTVELVELVELEPDALVAANPWHDEIGRFAPKGTGRRFGASQDEMRALFDPVRPLVDVLEGSGAKTYLVGGSVRDRLLGADAKDIDIEVHDMSVENVIALLEGEGARIDEVGKSFGVLKVTYNGETHDFSFPRTEVKTGEGHTGFDVTVDPYLGIEQALARRDFTMNALALDSDGNLIDPYGGVEDLRSGVLRHVSPAFSEDPLRILRGVQFAARMGLEFDPATAQLARDLLPELEAMHTDRVWGEFQKLGGKGQSMQAAVQALRDVGLDTRYGNIHYNIEPNLVGLAGDHRAAVALASIGIDPRQIGAPNTVARHMRDINTALAFQGGPAESRSLARELKYGTFADAERITGENSNVDPRVLNGPLPQLVSGNDVMARGIRGPAIGEVLRAVQRAQDNDVIATREDALAWLDEHTELTTLVAANPWHDEIGRFAPKGRGKRFGPKVLNEESDYERVDLKDVVQVEESLQNFADRLTDEMQDMLPDGGRVVFEHYYPIDPGGTESDDQYPVEYEAQFSVRNDDGKNVALMTRQIQVDEGSMYAAGLYVDGKYQGLGIGTLMQEEFEDWAASQGVTKAKVYATDIGRYAWMRAGYDWDGTHVLLPISKKLRSLAHDPARRDQLLTLADQFEEAVGRVSVPDHIPTPYELSQILSQDEILSDTFPNWPGVKPLRAAQPLYEDEPLAATANVSREARLEPVRRAWKIWVRQFPAAAEGYEVDPEAEAAWEALMADPDMLMLDDPDALVAAGPFDLDDFNVMTAEEWAVAFDVEAADIIGDVVVDAATGQPLRPGLNVTDQVITDLIDRHVARIRGLGPVVQASLRDALELAVTNLMPLDDVIREIQATGPLGETAARAIARTELTAATNGGMLTGWRRDGYPFKQWVSLHDERVRHAHLQADRQVVPTEQEFEVGGERAMYPGDPRLSVGNRINCRCYMDRIGESGQTIGTRLIDSTRAELYRLAQELQIPGRSKMLKEDLFQAIDRYRSGFGFTSLEEMNRAQLLIRARAAGIVGRSRMSKAELMIRLRALATGRNRDRWLIDAGHGTREQLEAVQAQLRADIAALTAPPVVAAGPPPSAEKTASLRASVFRRYGGKETGTALCVGCGARLHWAANTRWEQMTLIRLDPNVAWSARNAMPVCLADAAKLATLTPDKLIATFTNDVTWHAITEAFEQFANPWHDEIGRFAPKGTGTNYANIASRAREAEAAGSQISELDGPQSVVHGRRLIEMVRTMGEDFGRDHGVRLTTTALNQRHGRGTMNGLVATNPDGLVLGAIAYNKNPGDYHIEFLGSTGLVKGVGSQLVIPVMEQAAADGAKVTLLAAPTSQSAGPFWESMGFEGPSAHRVMSPADVKAWVANLAEEREGVLVAAGPPSDSWDPDDDRWAARAIELGLMTVVASAGQFANPWHDEVGKFAPKGTGTKFDIKPVDQDAFEAAVTATERAGEEAWGGEGSPDHQAFLDEIRSGAGAFADPAVGDAWMRYAKQNEFKAVSRYLRAGEDAPGVKDTVAAMMKAYESPPARPLPASVVYRGEVDSTRRKIGQFLKPGEVFTDKGFVSVSENSRSAQMFAAYEPDTWQQPSRTIYVIKPTAETAKIPVVAVDSPEQEWALPPGSQFRVGNITEHKRQGYINDFDMGDVTDRIVELEWIA